MRTDLRLAWRALRAAPGYALAAVCCLALGLGANAAVFQLADAIFFRPPPGVRDPAHLLRVSAERGLAHPGAGAPGFTLVGVSRAELSAASAATAAAPRPLVRAVAAYDGFSVPVGRGPGAEDRHALFVAPGYFAALGVSPARGRTFAADEERGAGAPVAVVSHRYWSAAFGGDPGAVGRTVVVYGRPVTVVGVAPRGFAGVDLTPPADLWFPLAQEARIRGEPEDPNTSFQVSLRLVARVADGADPAAVAGALRGAFVRAAPAATPGPFRFAPPDVRVTPLRLGDRERDQTAGRLTRWLAAVSVLVLLVACASVAGLALARGVARRRETAVRAALGAGRARLVRQVAAEGVLLTAFGAAAALAVRAGMAALLRHFPVFPELPGADWARTGGAGLAAVLLVAVVCAVLPALLATRGDLRGDLRGALHDAAGAASGASASRARAREVLLVGQLAVTLMLVAGAGLFLRSLSNALHADLGFDAGRAVMVSAGPHRSLGEVASGEAAERVRAGAAALPWARDASWSAPAPFTGFAFRELRVPGSGGAPVQRTVVNADEHFLQSLGIRLVRGRGFTAADRPAAGRDPQAVLVNETMARRDWPGRDPVGRCVQFRATPAAPFAGCVAVVGVVADVRANGLDRAPDATLYEPLRADPGPFSSLVVRLRAPADARGADAVRRALAPLVPDAPRLTAQPLAELLDPDLAPHRLGAALFGVYGALALVLAAVGLHGVVRYNAERRGRELAVRTALGARPADLVRLVAGGGARLALAGGALGLVGALAGARLLAGVLYGVRPADPLAVVGACALLAAVALAASWLPARRAAHADPAAALRAE